MLPCGHPSLIQDFNAFLPIGYRLLDVLTDLSEGNTDTITMTTPSGSMILPANNNGLVPSSLFGSDELALALQYVRKIQQRCGPETYHPPVYRHSLVFKPLQS